jgi:predicted metal-dependent phosphotriesterase family hydrolase
MQRAENAVTTQERSVVTVLGLIPAASLGVTDAHDHLFLSTPALPGQEFDDLQRSTAEVRAARATGIRTVVELTPIGCGRRPDLMRALSEATGVHVVAASGYHRDAHYPTGHWVLDASVDVLTERIVTDLMDGMHPNDWAYAGQPLDVARAGIIKAGASYQHITRAERDRLGAAARASQRTGAPIIVHTEVGTCGHEIADLLEGEGIPPQRIILAHLDRNPDAELHADLAARGVMLEYDTAGRIKYRPDSDLLDLIEAMAAAGHLHRLLLGLDLGRRDYLHAYGGGPGMTYLMQTFVPRLRRRIGEAPVETILSGNPAHAFAWSPVTESVA